MSEGAGRPDILSRVVARVFDFLIVMMLMELVPRAGFYAALMYILIADGLFEGASVGKKLMGLKVASERSDTGAIVRGSILRNLTLAVALVLWRIPLLGWFFFIGILAVEFIIMTGSAQRKRIGDEIAGTLVVCVIGKMEGK
ncbi:RDD family protein [Candidatus Magnetomonas plexicatena]|uniref:RDD family protein n=1 Tax=Candidatus Magnetomonas plexicatena TaxID=2552947 RepID=UPI0010FFCE64|nr:RDD family protein [Nitrospirales bacterium LBB_01]